MNSISQPLLFAPHLLPNNRFLSNNNNNMTGRKRKADDDDLRGDSPDRMSASPSTSHELLPSVRPSPSRTTSKRMRSEISGRPLALPRLLETLNAEQLRQLLGNVCERHPELIAEVTTAAPRPKVADALAILGNYETKLQQAFPLGRSSPDYAYNRVKQPLLSLIDALKDFIPAYLPPNEIQATTSLTFLDGATSLVHRLPAWEAFQHNRHKQEIYEDLNKAWALVIHESSKRAGGMQLQYGGWDQKLLKHNETSGGKLQEAVNEMQESLGWMGGEASAGTSIREQLLNGTFGTGVRVGPW